MTRPLYFLHIPKTAGSSIQYYLEQRFAIDEVCPAQLQPEIVRMPQQSLRRYRLFAGHFWGLERILGLPTDVLVFLREPVARLISNYRHILQCPDHRLHHWAKSCSIEEFARHPHLRNRQTRQLAAHHRHYRPDMAEDECLALAREVVKRAAFLGIFERMEKSLALLAKTFSWPPAMLPKINVTTCPFGLPSHGREVFAEENQLDMALYAWALRWFDRHWADVTLREARQAYERRLLERLQTPPLVFEMGEAICGTGWYAPERWGNEIFRWSGPDRTATVDLPIPPPAARAVRFQVLHITPPGWSGAPEVRLWEKRLPVCKESESAHATIYTAPVEASNPARKYMRLHFVVDETFCPAEIGASTDTRRLGIALSWIEVR